MSQESTADELSNDELVEKIHEIQEEIFDREDEIDSLVVAAASQEALEDLVGEGETARRRQRLRRLKADWSKMLDNSRSLNSGNDYELAAALVHFVGDVLLAQSDSADIRWIRKLEKYLEGERAKVS